MIAPTFEISISYVHPDDGVTYTVTGEPRPGSDPFVSAVYVGEPGSDEFEPVTDYSDGPVLLALTMFKGACAAYVGSLEIVAFT